MKATKLLITLCLVAASWNAAAQPAAVKKIVEMGQNDNQTMRHLDILTNRFGGRLIGSDAYENAAEWMMSEFKKWGIDSHLEEAGTLPVGFNRGPWFGRMIGEESMPLHFVTPSYTSGTKGIQRGHVVIEPRSTEEFNKIKGLLKGAWVLVGGKSGGWPIGHTLKDDSLRQATIKANDEIAAANLKARMDARSNNGYYNPKSLKSCTAMFYKQMLEAGVLGFIQAADVPLRALYDRPMMNDKSTNFDNLPEYADIKLESAQFEKIQKYVMERRNIELEFDIRNHFKMGPIKYHNVVASIKGSEFPDEYVIISGHLDAYDVATGGVDCGTGIAPMLEAARMIAKSGAKPKRTIVFVAFAGEEFGLLGAQAYCKTHKKELDKISNLFNRDGGPLAPVGISVPKAMYKDFKEICKPISEISADYPFEVKVAEPRKKPVKFGGTDATVFGVQGVPVYEFTCADFKGYNFDYGEIWHTERDVFNKAIPEYMNQAAAATAIVALGVANLDHQLSRKGMFTDEK